MVRFLLLLVTVAALVCAAPASASTIYKAGRDGSIKKVDDPYLPPAEAEFAPSAKTSRPASIPSAPAYSTRRASSSKSKRTVPWALKQLLAKGQLDQPTHDAYAANYAAAKKTLRKLKGTRKAQLAAVIKNLDATAMRGQLTSTRAPALFLTLERNRAWWEAGTPIGSGARISFPGSELVWQYYPGQGLQIQWLGTFGKANGYLKAKNVQNTKLKLLLDEATVLASARAGGLGWEYLFRFDGGTPPWVSGMAQATALQAFARAGIKYSAANSSDPARGAAYLATAHNGLAIFGAEPPEGVRVNEASGPHYLIYSFARALRVQNAFTQTISGLHDYAQLTGDPTGLQLFLQGEAELRAETPGYDTGAWSMYSNFRESNLHYHGETINFLKTLCASLTADAAAAPANGGVAPGGIPPLDPAVYCAAEAKYRAYLTTPPVLSLRPSKLRKGKATSLKFTLSKISRVAVTVRRKDKVLYSRTLTLGHGDRSVRFKPANSGKADVTLSATDLAGNKGAVAGEVTIRK
ncbi:MAG TPA: D-glucuronyl C5-epimerase family protein [Baekduia sp.]|nr:D-glucuronyl C5-epimerase family protein [Baekduia sp.]